MNILPTIVFIPASFFFGQHDLYVPLTCARIITAKMQNMFEKKYFHHCVYSSHTWYLRQLRTGMRMAKFAIDCQSPFSIPLLYFTRLI